MSLYGGIAENTRRNERQERGLVTFSTASTVITVPGPLRTITLVADLTLQGTTAAIANTTVTYGNVGTGGNKPNQFTIFQWQPTGHLSPSAASSISPGASPFAYTNNDGIAEEVVVTGGTVSSITLTRGGTTTASLGTSGIFTLAPGDVLTVTYSVVPTMTKFLFGASALAASTATVTVDWEVWGTL